MSLRLFCLILALFMLGYVVIVTIRFGMDLNQVIVGLVAAAIVGACAIALYVYQKKGEVS